jgi:CBS domain-containing protein
MGTDLNVGDVMTKKVIVVPMGENAIEVARLMKKYDIGSVIVVDEKHGKSAKGIITERDIVHKLIAPGKDTAKTLVESIMSRPLRVVKPDTALEDAAKAMRKNRIKRLPVVNDRNELIGILSENDLMKIFPAVVDLIEERAALK